MDEVKGLQQCQLNILKEFDRVCKKHDIPYFVAYGTCIGVVRHKGFIPWDDDVDVCMLAEDLDRLKEHAQDFDPRYFLQCRETDPAYGLAIARVRDCRTTLVEATEADRAINHGVFMDVYPLYPSYRSPRRAARKIVQSYLYRLLVYGKAPNNHGGAVKRAANLVLKLLPKGVKKAMTDHAYKVMRKETGSGYVSILYGGDEKLAFEKDTLFPTQDMPFEGGMVPVPRDVDRFLTLEYGDYMQLPPEEKRHVHHDYAFLDLENSYTQYRGRYYCTQENGQ